MSDFFSSDSLFTANNAWLALGLSAQLLFSARFLVQWLASERRRQSVIPKAFWYLSVGGASTLLLYAIHVRDPVFILGQSTGLFVYVRNLVLIKRSVADEGLARE